LKYFFGVHTEYATFFCTSYLHSDFHVKSEVFFTRIFPTFDSPSVHPRDMSSGEVLGCFSTEMIFVWMLLCQKWDTSEQTNTNLDLIENQKLDKILWIDFPIFKQKQISSNKTKPKDWQIHWKDFLIFKQNLLRIFEYHQIVCYMMISFQ
jgi:hypothetical protein